MMKSPEISARKIAIGLVCWFIGTNLLVGIVHVVDWLPFKIALFVCLAFLPGVVILRIAHIVLRIASVAMLYSFGLSLLVLMLSGLAANQILDLFVTQPLSLWGILLSWNIITFGLICISVYKNKQSIRLRQWPMQDFSKRAWLFLVASLLMPCLAALGAFRLNNGGDALFAQLALGWAAFLLVCAILLRRRLPDGLMAWFIFAMGLTILLMTSLRGWDIVGHDIEREFRVYTLTHNNNHWDIALNRDPYNACLSITILPEVFAKLLNISGLMVFKVILQVIFAACPVVVYILLRQYASKLAAVAGSMLFICYPTFINDSAMLTRQGVAYLFFALALLVISNRAQKKRYKVLFLLCASGAVLSHYSTAYMFVALFAIAVACKFGVTWWQKRGRKTPLPREPKSVVSPLFAGLLFLMTFMWYTQLTATSDGLMITVKKSFTSISKIFSADNKSSDTSTALLFGGGKNQVDLYQTYLTNSQQMKATDAARLTQYIPTLTGDHMPLTRMGEKAHTFGINISVLDTLRQNFAKVLQLLAVVGVVFAADRLLAKKKDAIELDFVCLSLAGLVMLILMVVMPILSINYGLLRAFQQALIFLLLPMVLLLVQASRYLKTWMNTTIATFSIVFLFLLFTGFFAQMLGGVSPNLSMNNSGLYFGLYYSTKADAQSFTWLKEHIPENGDVRAANFNRAQMHDPEYPFSNDGILPSQIREHSYVYLDSAQVLSQKFYAYYQSSPIIMTFPLDYYDLERDQIYSTSSTRIYR